MKKITILTVGTRGDVQPFVALAKGLSDAGYKVTVATHLNYEDLVRQFGLDFAEVTGNVSESLKSEEVAGTLNEGGKSTKFFKSLREEARPHIELAITQYYEASKDADAVISSALTLYIAHYLTLKLDIPLIFAAVNPAGTTREFPHILAAPSNGSNPLKRAYNYSTHLIYTELIWGMVRKDLEAAWSKVMEPIKLPKKDPMAKEFAKFPPLILYGYSPALLPKPPEWSVVQHVCGYFNLSLNIEVDEELNKFIQSGDKPVYVGLGSMGNPDADILAEIIIPELMAMNERAVILSHSVQLEKVFGDDERIHFIREADFKELFPKMKALIHHGGVGTTGLGVESGTPALIISFIADQRFWAYRLNDLGACPKDLPRKGITRHKFSKRFKELLSNTSYQSKTSELSALLQLEDGVATAVGMIGQWLDYKGTRR